MTILVKTTLSLSFSLYVCIYIYVYLQQTDYGIPFPGTIPG